MSRYGKNIAEAKPHLAEEWSDKNEQPIESYTPGSTKKVRWECRLGHEWVAPIDNRVYGGSGCPACTPAGARVLVAGYNDLATTHPEMSKEWHPTLNAGGAETASKGSRKRVWWLCQTCGHEWDAVIKSRVSRNSGCGRCAARKAKRSENNVLPDGHPLFSEWSDRNTLNLSDYTSNSNHRAWWKCDKGHEFRASIGDRVNRETRCKSCGFGGTSAREMEVTSTLRSWGITVREHHRQIDPAYEYDITVPEQGIAVEFNGLYWHSERVKGADYHLRKTFAANKAGWQLIHVWEDEWVYRRSVVEKMLRRKLQVSDEPRLNARSLTYRQVSSGEASLFLEENHIQGSSGGSWRGGLFKGDELVALMLMKRRSEGKYELTRFATSAIVRGGHSKLLKRFIGEVNPEQIITFADRGVSDGGLYEKAGFVKDGELAPDYMYRVGQKREHKFNYRKARFKKDPNLKYEEGLTEKQLADLNGLDRIYDAGKVRWVWTRATID